MLVEQLNEVMKKVKTKACQHGKKEVTVFDGRVQKALNGLSSEKICTVKMVHKQLTSEGMADIDIRTVVKAVEYLHVQVGTCSLIIHRQDPTVNVVLNVLINTISF